MTGRQLFVVRGALASVVATVLAAVSHTFGGGQAPAPTIVAAMAILLVLPAGLLMGGARRRPTGSLGRLLRISATTVVAQAAFHGAFSALGAPEAGVAVQSAHAHHGAPMALAAGDVHAANGHAPMLGAHVIAAVITIAILAYGEGVVLRGWRWIRAAVRALVAPTILPRYPRVLAHAVPRIRVTTAATPATGVRGPPILS